MPLLFEACLRLLSKAMRKLREEMERQMGNFYLDPSTQSAGDGDGRDQRRDDIRPLYDMARGVRLAEAAAQVRGCCVCNSLGNPSSRGIHPLL
jgi:hypothetical protein